MSLEITRGKSLISYKINEYCRTELLARINKADARWLVHSRYATPEAATAALLELERKGKVGG